MIFPYTENWISGYKFAPFFIAIHKSCKKGNEQYPFTCCILSWTNFNFVPEILLKLKTKIYVSGTTYHANGERPQ